MLKKKKVLYLIGAGATHSEATLYDDSLKVLTFDISEGIRQKIIKKKLKPLSTIANELMGDNIDIEQLITLYETSGIYKYSKKATDLRRLFREELLERIEQLPANYTPKLLSSLIDMYNIKDFEEEIVGFLTLNYDDFIEVALQHIRGSLYYNLLTINKHKKLKILKDAVPLLKLHGSFNWKNEFPIKIMESKIKNSDNVLWIPPGVIKRREQYPFNLIWGKAKELLYCDILRVIGCSLNRNDWELVSLLQNTQKFKSNGEIYDIEVIDYPKVGEKKKEEYPYLKIKSILDIYGFKLNLVSDITTSYDPNDPVPNSILDYINSNKLNIFERWIRWIGEDMKSKGIDIDTPSHYFKNFVEFKI